MVMKLALATARPPRRKEAKMVKIYEPPTEEMIDQALAKLRADYSALQERCEKLERENAEWEFSFDLFNDAMRRGAEMFREAHPEYIKNLMVPSYDRLIMWLMEELSRTRTANAALRRELTEARERPNARKKVCLCGSSRFVDIMAVCQWFIERDEGAIGMGLHLLPYWYCKDAIPGHLAEHEGCADKMNELHLRKIDLADEIFVVNFNDYIGDSTRNEIEYAKKTGKPVRWFTHDPIGEKVKQAIKTAVEGK